MIVPIKLMEEIIQRQAINDKTPEQSDNVILNDLDSYLNGDFETGRDDYTKINSNSIPSPVLQENGLWTIPGTTKEFNTSEQAYKAVNRYTEYITQNEASMLMYGINYTEYIHGDKDEQTRLSQTKKSEFGTGDNGPTNLPTDNSANEPVPETPATYTTTS